MVKIDPLSGKICFLIDPDGPIRWISNTSLVGRQFFGLVKNNLVVWSLVNGHSVIYRIPVGFKFNIDFVTVTHQKLQLVKVFSIKEGLFSTIDLNSRKLVGTGLHNFPPNFQVPEGTGEYVSPDGKLVAVRENFDGTRAPLLIVYDVIE